VSAAIYADRASERAWQADQTTLTSQKTALTSIQTATEAIATDMQSLNTLTGPLASRTVTSSNTSEVTATAATGTVAGTHSVVVNSLATAAAWYSGTESSSTTELPASSFTFIPATGKSVTFQTGSNVTDANTGGDTLDDLASAINGYTDPTTKEGLGVTATVISDSAGSRLAIVSNTAGAAADFSVAEPYTSWSAPQMASGDTLGANSFVLTSSAGTATVTTTSGETYQDLANAINSATVSTSYSSTATGLAKTTTLTKGSVTTIKDNSTGKTFSYTAASGDTIDTLNSAIAAAVKAGTLSANVTGSVASGKEVISEGSIDQGMAVSTTDSALGAMGGDPLGLTAAITTDASGNTNLTITGQSVTTGTGTSAVTTVSPFTINEPSSSSSDSAFSFTEAQQGANASLTVDGVPISSTTNTVTGAIPGVTLSLLGTTSSTAVDLTVASDTTAVSTAINQFVTDYNTAIGLVTTQFNVDSTTNAQGVLATDPTMRSLQNMLEQALSYSNTPATGTTTVSTLSDLGITMANDGTLSVDSTTLTAALTNNASDVQNFFEGKSLNGFANTFYSSLNTYTSPSNGAFTVDLSSISTEYNNLTSQINSFETNYITPQQTLLTADYTAAEVALQDLPQQMEEINSELGFTNKS
jgi:flagellar hook-associated protein 2